MSQKTTRKKRLKVPESTSNLQKREDSEIANYFKNCLSIVPDNGDNNENKLPYVQNKLEANDTVSGGSNAKLQTNSRISGAKAKSDRLNHLIPTKKYKSNLEPNASNVNTSKDKTKSPSALSCLSLIRSQKSFNKSNNIFNSITASFSSSKILSLQSLSNVNSQKRLELSTWGLPPLILEKYHARGIKTMFPWQVECLANKKILEENRNLVYSAPTSAGKTLVAEFLMLKTVLERHKKAIFILPFVSVVREKMFYFQDLLADSGVRVEGFMGGVAPAGGFSSVHIAVATIEKANSLINRLMEDGELVTLGAVVIDELHLLGDPGRGYLLELLLTKLRYMTLSLEHINIQLIGMSATLPNLPLIAEWLDAELYKTDFRPIPLNEQCKIGTSLLDSKFNTIRELQPASDIVSDTDNIIQLCIETISGGHGVLIFCPTKSWCEKLSLQMASMFFQLGRDNTPNGQILRNHITSEAVEEILEQLKHCPVGLDNVLKKTVSFGVAFHHAGLTMDERDIIEGGFRIGSLKVLIATSTLSSGVNLPARRVIIRSPIFNGRPIEKLTYQQMIGRAGRMGKDTAGESILVCKPTERTAATNLMTSTLEPIVSCLEGSGPLIRALLEAVASQIVKTLKDLDFYSKCTFVYKCEESEVKGLVEDAVKFLISNEFLLVKDSETSDQRMVATCLGKACLSASIPPREGLFLFEELQRARKCFVLDTELHVIYLVTPFNSGSQISQIDWMAFMELWRTMSESERRVGQLVGIEERFLLSALRGVVKPGKTLNIHRRFYTALALYDLVREVPLNAVCKKYNCCRGLLQSLQQSSSTFAGMVTNFCKELKWDCMELLFAQFQARLHFGVSRDLLDLLKLPSLNGLRARSLYKHGITTVAELAIANELDVEEALNKALPFESEKDFDGENEAEIAKRTKMRTVFITGKDGMTAREAAATVIKEARTLLQNELGIRNVNWDKSSADDEGSPRSPNDSPSNLRQLSLVDEVTPTRNVSVEVHTISNSAQSIKISVEPMQSLEEERSEHVAVVRKSSFNKKRLSTINETLSTTSAVQTASGRNKSEQEITSRTLRSTLNDKTNAEANVVKTPELENRLSKGDESSLLANSNDVINASVEPEAGMSNTLRSKLAEKTKSMSKEVEITICSMDFQDTPVDRPIEKKGDSLKVQAEVIVHNKENSSSTQSFQFSERAIDEIMKVAEEKLNHKDEDEDMFPAPAPVDNVKVSEPKKRNSGESNCSKSPSLFSDSSFLDSKICSILEKNVIECSVFADFEKSNFTLPNKVQDKVDASKRLDSTMQSKSNVVKDNQPGNLNVVNNQKNINKTQVKAIQSNKRIVSNESNINDSKQPSLPPMTWTEDSWDQTKNLRSQKQKAKEKEILPTENVESQSPSLLQITRSRVRIKPISSTQATLNKIKASTSKAKASDSPLIGTPKSILKSRIFGKDDSERSPIASIKTYDVRKPVVPSYPMSNCNKSDSEDSIVSSQTADLRQATVNKTRSRIEQKLTMQTQKLSKSTKLKDFLPGSTTVSNLLKQSSMAAFLEDSNASDSDNQSVESCLLFDSDDSANSVVKKAKKISSVKTASSTASISSGSSSSSISITSSTITIKPVPSTTKTQKDESSLTAKSIEPLNVANSKKAFRLFRAEIEGTTEANRRKDLAVCLATEACAREATSSIGNRIVGGDDKKRKDKKNDLYVYGDRRICGIVISWGVGATYYMPFGITPETKITIKERISFLRDILTNPSTTLRCFDAKELYKILYTCCELEASCKFLDPRAGDWLLNAEICSRSYSELTAQYFPRGLDIANLYEDRYRAPVLTGVLRAGTKAMLTWYISDAILAAIKRESSVLLKTYLDVEMPTILLLAQMELRGFAVNLTALQELCGVIKNDLVKIEEEAFKKAGRKFNFYSTKEVSQVLGLVKKGRRCTNKNALKSCENPISNLITLWRKLSTVQTKIVFPLLHLEKRNNRIHGNCITYTVTGRVSMHEPNLQTIPRDFKSDISGCVLSVRMAFIPSVGNVMLSADFCQLELRILAHFSQDPVLCKLMHEKGDIFKNIAAKMNKVTEDSVDDDMRQRAKQLCYAMIYGMGLKSLAETLSVSESQAKDYLEAFMGTYKGIRVWLNSVSEQARLEGFVSTIAERRRALPNINSNVAGIKAQAERQAVNTKVQGTAADITKRAMVLIENKLRKEFNYLPLTFPTTQSKRKLRSSDADGRPRGAYLILQLHDELLYEVNSNDLEQVASIVKESMENAVQLRVPLPVKVKVGSAWGNLEEYKV